MPGIIGSLIVDAVDQTVFQTFGGLPSNYQDYDKALDLYYQVIAYTSMLRNWTNPAAFAIGQFLWYYRLIGTVAFEMSSSGWLLFAFPNTFEYYFIAYEAIRTRWDPSRIPGRALLLMAAGIWIFIKLPQEYWIHIANLDYTDEVQAHPWLLVATIALVGGVVGAVALNWKRLPAPDWPFTVYVDAHRPPADYAGPSAQAVRRVPFWSTVAEKVLLIGLISVVFANVLHAQATHTQVALGVAEFVLVNATISHLFAWRGHRWHTTFTQFFAMTAINAGTVGVLVLFRPYIRADAHPRNALFLVLLISLLITLYDRYGAMRERRIERERRTARTTTVAPIPKPA